MSMLKDLSVATVASMLDVGPVKSGGIPMHGARHRDRVRAFRFAECDVLIRAAREQDPGLRAELEMVALRLREIRTMLQRGPRVMIRDS